MLPAGPDNPGRSLGSAKCSEEPIEKPCRRLSRGVSYA